MAEPQAVADLEPSIGEAFDKMARKFVAAKLAHDKTKEAEKAADKERRAREAELYDLMESGGIKSTRHDELGLLTRQTTIRAYAEDEQKLRATLDDMGLLQALTKVVFKQAGLNDLAKKNLGAMPDGLGAHVSNKIRYTPPKPSIDVTEVPEEEEVG